MLAFRTLLLVQLATGLHLRRYCCLPAAFVPTVAPTVSRSHMVF